MPNTPDRCSTEHETQRLQALADYDILDTPEEPAFDEIVELLSLICETPIAVINFIDRDRQWFKSVKGLDVRETPLDVSICAHALLQPGVFIVPDTTLDPRFANNPLVTQEPHLRFYAGALLHSRNGYPLGTLCVLDYQPRELSERQRFALKALANQVMMHLELMQAHRQQTQLASTDPLTGLLNRRAFEQRLDQEVALIKRGGAPAALMLIDLDDFKSVNDTRGHQAGDQIIERFTALCRETFRQADVMSRWGGDEFMVMLPKTGMAEAQRAAERLHQRLAATPMLEASSPAFYSTASIGVCSLTSASNMDECLQRSDKLLYQAKDQGRNRTVCEE